MKNEPEKKLHLISPYSLDECHSLLKDSVNTSFFPYSGSCSVFGSVSKTSIRLAKKNNYRNSFQTFLIASLKPAPRGTTITGSFGMHPLIMPFMAIWFGMATLGCVFTLVNILSFYLGYADTKVQWMGVVIAPLLLIFGFGLIKGGRYLARNESWYLKDFLMKLLQAREVPGAGQ